MKIVKEDINEKFTEVSDPIKDMDIGLPEFWKEQAKILGRTPVQGVYDKYFSPYLKTHLNLLVGMLYRTVDDLAKGAKNEQDVFENACRMFMPRYRYNVDSALKNRVKRLVAKVLKEQFNIVVDPLKKIVNEKFTEKSDPLKDMGIGARKIWKEHYKILTEFAPVVTYKDYFEDKGRGSNEFISPKIYWLFNTLKYMIKDYSPKMAFEKARKESEEAFEPEYWRKQIRKEVADSLKKHFSVDVNESVNEKFTQESDPIRDLGIGIKAEFNKWLTEYMNAHKDTQYNRDNPNGLLILCAYKNQARFIEYLITQEGANPNHDSAAALRSAAFNDNVEAGVLLVKLGAKINIAKKHVIRWKQSNTLIGLTKIKDALKNL